MLTPIAIKCTVRDVICIGRKRKSNHSEGCTDLNDPFDFQIYFSVEKSHPWQWMAEIAFKHISGITQYNVNTKILFLMVTYNHIHHQLNKQYQVIVQWCTPDIWKTDNTKSSHTYSAFSSCSWNSSSLKPNWSMKFEVICCSW